MVSASDLTDVEILDLTLDLPVPSRDGAFYRVQLPAGGGWSTWLLASEPCPFDEVLSVQMHNIDWESPEFTQVMRQFKVGGRPDEPTSGG